VSVKFSSRDIAKAVFEIVAGRYIEFVSYDAKPIFGKPMQRKKNFAKILLNLEFPTEILRFKNFKMAARCHLK